MYKLILMVLLLSYANNAVPENMQDKYETILKSIPSVSSVFFSRSTFPPIPNGYTIDAIEFEISDGGPSADLRDTDPGTNYLINGDYYSESNVVLEGMLTVVNGDMRVKNLVINQGSLYVSGSLIVDKLLYAEATYFDHDQRDNILYVAKDLSVSSWVNIDLEAVIGGSLEAEKIVISNAYEAEHMPVVNSVRLDKQSDRKVEILDTSNLEDTFAWELCCEDDYYGLDAYRVAEWLQGHESVFK